MKKKTLEQVIQKFSYRCPYCDQPISYDQFNLKVGENEVKCPFCKKKYIKVVFDESPPPQSSPIKGEEKKGSPIRGGGEILGNFPAKGKRSKSR